jgi:hypothetical protein
MANIRLLSQISNDFGLAVDLDNNRFGRIVNGVFVDFNSGGGSTPTLQAVTDTGNTTSNPLLVSNGTGAGSSNAQLSTEQVSVSKWGDSEGMVAPGLLQLYANAFASTFGIDLNVGIVTGSDDIKEAFKAWLGIST